QQALPGVPLEFINLGITSSGVAYQASFEKTQDFAGNYTTGGVSFWNGQRWQVIAPPPFKYKTDQWHEPRILLITPKSGPPHLYAYTGTDLYEYTGPFTLN
ncbi:MAG TPA: hypothetical protein VFN23_12395, partial [Ktedonobacteraceae bacterium]|nr:hypothetical protein [Ktedonobacteraceae bacterium]